MNVIAAPIFRYNDPRLCGTFLVQPWSAAYEWIRTVTNPWHPACNPVVECAVRGFKILSGIFALAATSVPALTGRLIQIGHYHLMSKQEREKPRPIGFFKNEDSLHFNIPAESLEPSSVPTRLYYAKTACQILSTLRFGFKFDNTYDLIGFLAGPAIYASETSDKKATVEELEISLDLKPEEIAYVPSKNNIPAFLEPCAGRIGNPTALKERRKGFIMNGYRAVKFDTPNGFTWAIYDPSCIHIKAITKDAR